MGEAFVASRGGGAALNFKLVAYATEEILLAATPKENTIGIIPEIPMNGWGFYATEPVEPAEGMVWITTGPGSDADFNALKKNAIQVYPMSAKQYVGGAWVYVTAMSYQGGEWRDWYIYAYGGGDSGWKSIVSGASGWTPGTMLFSNGAIVIENTSNTGVIASATKETYDLANIKTIEFDIDSKSTGLSDSGYAWVAVANKNEFPSWNPEIGGNILPNGIVASKTFNSAGTVSLDVSNFVGDYYIAILATRIKKVYCTKVTLRR